MHEKHRIKTYTHREIARKPNLSDDASWLGGVRALLHTSRSGRSRFAIKKVGLDWIGLGWVGVGWVGLDWLGMGWKCSDLNSIWQLNFLTFSRTRTVHESYRTKTYTHRGIARKPNLSDDASWLGGVRALLHTSRSGRSRFAIKKVE